MMEEKFAELPPERQDPRVPWKPANAVERCESSGGHVVKAPTWPPVRKGSEQLNEPPSLALKCERCDAHLIVYTDSQPGVKVIKPTLEVSSKK